MMSYRSESPRFPTVTIRHPNPRDASHDQLIEFVRRLVAGAEEFVTKRGLDPTTVPAHIREKLLGKLSALISVEKIEHIHSSLDATERRELVESLVRSVVETIMATLASGTAEPRRGAKRRHGSRDEKIYALKKEGLSFGQIAQRLKVGRGAVHAAYRREETRRKTLYELYKQLRQGLRPFGLILKEQPSRHPQPVAKSNR
jgi:hypothetical protein